MPQMIYHNSHELYYRNPFGAVEADTVIHMKLFVSSQFVIKSVKLRLWKEGKGATLLPMTEVETKEEGSVFGCETRAASKGCLLWYYFVIEMPDGKTLYYGNNEKRQGGEGVLLDHEPPSYQITVYDRGAKTPDWFKSAVMYQIFPDRFYRKEGPKLPQKKNAVYHMRWEDEPFYYKDVDTKEILSYDFYGGNLAGIQEKLPYLKELGISVIYMNPIFKAESNHRYDTGDYHMIDPLLGTQHDLKELCDAARKMGIRIILDGVFSHTGSNSKYFNRYGNYDSVGAYQSEQSPYREWYTFTNYPHDYESWWGFDTLPNVRETTPSYMNFIIYSRDSVMKYWLKQGISGWRLDVIDELPGEFSRAFYRELKLQDKEKVLIGEVWEDASNKVSYGVSREYLCGHELDSAMNYPFRKAVIDFLMGRTDAANTNRALYSLYENYPKENFYAMMNLLGSHDVERILTVFGEAPSAENVPAARQAEYRLPEERRALGLRRLKLASLWQMTFPGVPCVYYGDEIGMEGYRDPYNRRPYPWKTGDEKLKAWYKEIIALRNRAQALQTGEYRPFVCGGDIFGYVRRIYNGADVFGHAAEDDAYLVLFNRHHSNSISATVDLHGTFSGTLKCIVGEGKPVSVRGGKVKIEIKPMSGAVYRMAVQSKFPRRAGILLHPTSLPSANGIGDIGAEAYRFVDFLADAKQKLWQILPLNPVAYGDSPYQSPSAFAGNPALISLETLQKEGFFKEQELTVCRGISFEKVLHEKRKLLCLAFQRFKRKMEREYFDFCKKEIYWLDDYALYMALKDKFQKPWFLWPEELKRAESDALLKERSALSDVIDYYKFEQYEFWKQWRALKAYANQKGIQIIGDMPIFVAHDSADVWANQGQFQLDEEGKPEKVAGVPPDYFSRTGQLWGNPHYRWDVMRQTQYLWWKNRIRCVLGAVDIIRIDHFRGFESYWAVDGGAKTAMQGEWVKGPGAELFLSIRDEFGDLPIIAEDLGIITDEVNELKDFLSLPGMQVLHFALRYDMDGRASFACSPNVVAYTGTHDNNTTVGWYQDELEPTARDGICRMLDIDEAAKPQEVCRALIEYLYHSNAATVVVPLQDVLQLGGEARMNLPGSFGGTNWHWRMPVDYASGQAALWLAGLVDRTRR